MLFLLFKLWGCSWIVAGLEGPTIPDRQLVDTHLPTEVTNPRKLCPSRQVQPSISTRSGHA